MLEIASDLEEYNYYFIYRKEEVQKHNERQETRWR